MIDVTEIHNVSTAIRDAVAPVFLLTGIGSLLGVITGRLARVLDRARMINHMDAQERAAHREDLIIVVKRVKLLRRAIALATFAALSVCLSIVCLFIASESSFDIQHLVMWSFITSMCSIILALICFLLEIVLTSREVIIDSTFD